MYASYFKSDVVYRLWDQIIYNLSVGDKTDRKRGLGWLLAPAANILKTRQKKILRAKTAEEVLLLNRQAFTTNNDNPDLMIERIKLFNDWAFVEEESEKD
jgi:hypothetical protein